MLSGTGTVAYNGWTFQGPRVSTELSVSPQLDEARRTTTCWVGRLTVNAIVTDDTNGQTAGGSAATNMETLRNLLMKTGGALTYSGWGTGDITVNTTSADRDCMWGPKTVSLEMKSIGSTYAFEVLWVVEFALAECGSGVPVGVGIVGNVLSYNYGVTYSIDQRGLTTRTISGHISIILNRASAGSTTFTKSADSLRDRIKPAVPVQFTRLSQEYRLSLDKSRLDFTFVDRELPSENSFPQGISTMDATHRTRVAFPKLQQAENVISGFVEVVKGYPMAWGMDRILLFLRERMFVAKYVSKGLFITSIEITEHIFQRRIDFSLTYRILTSGPNDFIAVSSLFKPVQSANLQAWGASLEQNAWHNRGVARLTFNTAADRIVDPCNQGSTSLSENGQYTNAASTFGSLGCQCPPKSASYYYWRNSLDVETESGTAVHTPMSLGFSGSESDVNPPSLGDGTIIAGASYSQPIKPVIQVLNNRVMVVMRGAALRVGYPSEIPELIRFLNSSNEFKLVESKVTNEPVSPSGCCLVYRAMWEFRYEVRVTPSQLSQFIADLPNATIKTRDDPNGTKVTGG